MSTETPMMSSLQQQAVGDAVDWFNNGADGIPMFRLFGYAGTGKTTIAKEIANRCGGAAFAAFTGKAASVLRTKGCHGASTIHSLIYEVVKKGEEPDDQEDSVVKIDAKAKTSIGNVEFRLRSMLPASLVIVDECSMVGRDLGDDLMSFDVPVLVLGDPAQLPPVGGAGYFTPPGKAPDVMLTEIHRQQEGSGIIDIATAVRTGQRLKHGDYSESQVLPLSQLHGCDPLAFDQMIVGKNATRKLWNARIRKRLGRTDPMPEPGDKLVCLRNNRRHGLMNGETFECKSVEDFGDRLKLEIARPGLGSTDVMASKHHFENRDGEPDWTGDGLTFFDYGYALTCHKSQGSQWPRVLVVNESRVFRDDAARWLYTAVTRASEHVTVFG